MKITKPKKKNPINPHISLVKRWLANNDSVTLQELKDNRESAYADGNAAETLYAASAAASAAAAAEAATEAGASAADAAYWIRRYEGLTND